MAEWLIAAGITVVLVVGVTFAMVMLAKLFGWWPQ